MLTCLLKLSYVVVSAVLAGMIVYGKLFVFKKKKPQFVSDYAAAIAGIFGGYSILSLVFAWIFPDMLQKFIMLFFALSPFIIGFLATYYTEKYYTVIQVGLLILSFYYVII